jgi:diphosphoinositol-polyphosphate diphosphatase
VSSSRYPDKWVVPAGGIEPGEDSKETAIREVQEEVSTKLKVHGLFDLDLRSMIVCHLFGCVGYEATRLFT